MSPNNMQATSCSRCHVHDVETHNSLDPFNECFVPTTNTSTCTTEKLCNKHQKVHTKIKKALALSSKRQRSKASTAGWGITDLFCFPCKSVFAWPFVVLFLGGSVDFEKSSLLVKILKKEQNRDGR